MLRIRSTVNEETLFTVIGRMDSTNLIELKNLLQAESTGQHTALDLKELTLVDRDAVRFLKQCQSDGIELRNCSAYISEWITREKTNHP